MIANRDQLRALVEVLDAFEHPDADEPPYCEVLDSSPDLHVRMFAAVGPDADLTTRAVTEDDPGIDFFVSDDGSVSVDVDIGGPFVEVRPERCDFIWHGWRWRATWVTASGRRIGPLWAS